MTQHYPLSPSSLHRTMACSGSLNHAAASRSSVYADEGSEAHALAAEFLKAKLAGEEIPRDRGSDEMRRAVFNFVNVCEPIARAASVYGIEETLAPGAIPGLGGTPDFYAIEAATPICHIVDYKHGAGVPVAAERNTQLLGYAVLLLERYPHICGFHLVIVQPRTAGATVDPWHATPHTVREYADQIKALAALPPEQRTYNAGDHCRWCPAIADCDHLHAKAMEVAQSDFDEIKSDAAADRWPELMKLAPAIKKLLDAIPGRMLDAIQKGREFAGWKAVKSIGHRAWSQDEAETLKALAKMKLGKRVVCETKLKTPAQLDREGYGAEIAELVSRRDNGFTVVAASDKRPAVVFETAADTFEDLSFLE